MTALPTTQQPEKQEPALTYQVAPIISCICTYRDAQFLRSTLDSVSWYSDAVIILDGKFRGFRDLPKDNTEQIYEDVARRFDPDVYTQDYIASLGRGIGYIPQKFIYLDTKQIHHKYCLDCKRPLEPSEILTHPLAHKTLLQTNVDLPETKKRDLFFGLIREGFYAFIIDGDEVAIGDVKAGFEHMARSQARIGWVYLNEDGNPGFKPRFLRVEKAMHYGKNHWTILDKDSKVVTDSLYNPNEMNQVEINEFELYNFSHKRKGERQEARIEYRELMSRTKWDELIR